MNLAPELARLFDAAVAASASAIHVAPGEPPRFRVHGVLTAAPDTATDRAESFLRLFPTPTRTALQSGTTAFAETSVPHGEHLFTVSLHRSGGDFVATVRLTPVAPPTLAVVGGESVAELSALARETRGLILVSGGIGSGKHTTAFALLQEINAHEPRRIYTVEESPMHQLRSETGMASSIIIGQDAPDYDAAIRLLLRGADADVVFLADLPTVETAQAALQLAQTGCLVIASVAAPSASAALATLSGGLSEEWQPVLAEQLVAVTNQRLVTKADGLGKVAEYEILRGVEAAPDLAARLYTTTFPATP